MTQNPPTLIEVIAAYQQRGRRLRTGEALDPADVSMLIRLSNSREAAGAFAGILEEAKKALAKRLEEEEKAFAKGAKEAEEAAKAFANSAEEATKTFVMKAPFLIDDCVEAREIYGSKHQAQVERLRNTPATRKCGRSWPRWRSISARRTSTT